MDTDVGGRFCVYVTDTESFVIAMSVMNLIANVVTTSFTHVV